MTTQSLVRNEDQKCCYRGTTSQGVRALWEITSACNLECDFCLVEKKRARTVTVERAIAMADDLVAEGVDKVMVSGGEPLLYKGIYEVLVHLVEKGVLVKLLTNGTIHDERVFDLVRRTPSMEVSVSLQTADAALADEVFQKPGSFSKIERTLDLLPRERMNVIAVYNTMTADHVEALVDWVAARGIPCLSIINVFKDPVSPARFRDDCLVYRTRPDGVPRLFAMIDRKREEHAGRMVIRTTQFRGHDDEVCGAGRSVFYIDATGCLLPCTLTDNRAYREAVAGMSVREAMAYYREHLPELPDSSCVPLLVPRRRPSAA